MADADVLFETVTATPIVFVISDARGETATGVVSAAASQFTDDIVIIKRLGEVRSVETVKNYLDENVDPDVPLAVFHTVVDRNLRRDIRRELDKRGIPSIDLLGPAVTIISTLTGEEPVNLAGHRTKVEIHNV
ncbi:MAG: kinase/pyrophosphorylase [Atopobiaceae bacterium]|jgi:regulator of PEP synthase PpsR (kinase-PPPase family)|nr:kinase/pyrophosphorylase [Atopobiaceae bacterium]